MKTRSKRAKAPAAPSAATPPPAQAGLCEAKTTTGKPCGAMAQTGRRYCYQHDPSRARERTAARKRGGARTREKMKRRTLPVDAPPPSLDTSAALVAHLGELIHKVEIGALDTKPAAVVAQLANVLLRALANVEVVERIAAIEKAVAGLPGSEAEQARVEVADLRRQTEAAR